MRNPLSFPFPWLSKPLESDGTEQVPAPSAPRQRVMAAGGKRVLRVLSYDVHHCLGLDGRWSPARIAEVIERSGAEVVCLQNVDVGHRCGEANQAEQIRSLLQAWQRVAMLPVQVGFALN